ncbi:hypothetical protein [Amycolatopsis jiangsuensis]|uniref:Uncharacterized protein n=1 Tax=Amycolatopsis jiangsuensis TaxID=1181879 RepID=A0A840J1I8_9PSEU|nr:hypothetical protein [Amycolatopsis jiangsuensis]MBB4687292.1 hypothetical protein [Amycolatopsis jiangsuensis]
MGNGDDTGSALKDTAKGAAIGATYGAIAGPEGAVVGAAVGGLVGAAVHIFSGGPTAENAQANVGGGSITATEIYKKISAGNTTSLEHGQSESDTLGRTHSDRANSIEALNNKMGEAWQGNSASAATGGAGALKMWHDDSANNLGKSRSFITNQMDAFHDVHGKVQQLPDEPPEMEWYDHQPFSDKDDEINKYNQDSQTNVQAYTAYYGSSNQNAGGMPQYNVWQGNNISDGGSNPNVGGVGPGGVGNGGGGFGGGGAGGFTPPKTNMPKVNANTPKFDTPKTNTPNYTPPKTDVPSYTPPNDNTSASGYVPPSVNPGSFGPGGSGGSGGFGPGGGGAGGFGPGGGGSGSGAGGFGAAGFGPGGFGTGGMGSGAAAGEGAGGAGSGMRGAGMGGAGAAGKAGSSGMGGMGGARGGGKKGEEDQEHQTKYLVEEDNNELFGSDQLTVPPVIGE